MLGWSVEWTLAGRSFEWGEHATWRGPPNGMYMTWRIVSWVPGRWHDRAVTCHAPTCHASDMAIFHGRPL